MRIVADTNVILSGLFYGGNPGELLDAAARGEIELRIRLSNRSEHNGLSTVR